MQRGAPPVTEGMQWLKCTKCEKVVRHYREWPVQHDIDGGVWMPTFKSINEILNPEYQFSVAAICNV